MGNTRVLIDWDGDGYTNKGVSLETPPNVYTGAPYMGKSNTAVVGSDEGLESEDIYAVHEYGLSYKRLTLGGDADHGLAARVSYTGLETWQQLPSDPQNLLEGTSFSVFSGARVGAKSGSSLIRRQALETLTLPAGTNLGDYVRVLDAVSADLHSAFTIGYSSGSLGVTHPGGPEPLFLDGFNQYTHTNSTAVTWGGITVLPSTTYTFVCRVNTNYATTTPTARIRVYAPSATVTFPNFGRLYVAGADTAMGASNTWTTCSVTFTTGAAQTSVGFGVSIEHTGATTPKQNTLAGVMLLVGSVAAPTRFWDGGITNIPNKFAAVLEASKAYTVSFWARCATAATTIALTGTLNSYQTYTNTEVSEGTANFTGIEADWVRCDLTLPSRAYERGFSIDWTAITANGTPLSVSVGVVLELTGLTVTEGATFYPYHAGTLYAYDNLSSYALRALTKSGRGSADDIMAYEGTATIELNNETKLFSPENEASPLYGLFAQNRRVEIEYLLDDVWTPLWTGWTFNIDVTPGENQDNRATLICNQGFFRMRESSFTAPLERDTTIGPVVEKIMEEGGWRAADSPYQSNLGYNLRLDENFFISGPDMLFAERATGINMLPLVGQDWGRKTQPETAIKTLLESENAVMWIARDGRLVLVDRNYWVEDHGDILVDIDTEIQEAEYSFGQGLINHVEVSLSRKKLNEAATVWETKSPFRVKPRVFPTDVTVIEIHAEHVEGRQKTVLTYTLDGMVKTVYTTDPGLGYGYATPVSGTVADKVVITLVPVGAGLYHLKVVNDNAFFVWLDLEIKGDLLDTGDGITVIFEDKEAIAATGSLHSLSISNAVVGDEYQAANMGAYHVLRNSVARGEFSSIEYNDASNILGQLEVGTQILIHETQTDQTSQRHFVIAEDFTIEYDEIKVKYTLMRGFENEFILTETSAVDPDDDYLASGNAEGLFALAYAENFVEDQTRVATYNGATAAPQEDSTIEYNTGFAPNVLILDSPPGQVKNYVTGEILSAGVVGVLTVKPPSTVGQTYNTTAATFGSVNASHTPWVMKLGTKYRLVTSSAVSTGGVDRFNAPTQFHGLVLPVKNWGGVAQADDIQTTALDGAEHTLLDFLTYAAYPAAYISFIDANLGGIFLIQFSNVKATAAVTSCHYHLYAKRQTGYAAISYTLTVYDSATGVVAGSQSLLVGDTPVHFEVTPTGLTTTTTPEGVEIYNVFATFGKTTEDYTEHEVIVQGYGFVPDTVTVTSAADLHKTPTAYKLYP